jgi:short-subunit dehydrogenase involved in D-alanine esterification of teichoic acids
MSEKILIIGKNSKIAKEFIKKVSKSTTIIKPSKTEWDMNNIDFNLKKINQIKKMDKILLLQSVISSTPILKRKSLDILSQISINLLSVIKVCEIALRFNKNVKIIILGSESGIKGSFDIIYALTKAAIHKYVEERKIKYSKQQLLCIAPSTVIDSKMTLKRRDGHNVTKSIKNNPKKRGLLSKEISNLIYSLFYEQTNYLSNIVIRLDGGKFARM